MRWWARPSQRRPWPGCRASASREVVEGSWGQSREGGGLALNSSPKRETPPLQRPKSPADAPSRQLGAPCLALPNPYPLGVCSQKCLLISHLLCAQGSSHSVFSTVPHP